MNLANVDLRLLRVFHGLVEHGGFAGAQVEMGLSLSTLSVHLSNLEKRLGMTLCERGRRGFRLTAKGERVYRSTKRLFDAMDAFCEEAAALRQSVTGTLTVGVADNTISDPNCPISAAVDRFEQRDNDVHIHLIIDRPTALATALCEGRLDLAVSSFPRASGGVACDLLYTEVGHVYCARGHPLCGAEGLAVDRALSKSSLVSRLYRLESDQETLPTAQHKATVEHLEAQAHLILSGHYIGFLPDHFAAQFVKAGALRVVAPERFEERLEIMLARRRGRATSAIAELFRHDLAAVVHGEGPLEIAA